MATMTPAQKAKKKKKPSFLSRLFSGSKIKKSQDKKKQLMDEAGDI